MKKSEKVMNAKGRSLGSTHLLVTEGGRENKNTQKDEESLRNQEGREREGTWPSVAVQKAHCPWLNEQLRQEVQRDAKLHRAAVEDKNSRTDFGKLFSNN